MLDGLSIAAVYLVRTAAREGSDSHTTLHLCSNDHPVVPSDIFTEPPPVI